MLLSEKFSVPPDAALLYDFLNTRDLRTYVEGGAPHEVGDELATSGDLEAWMDRHGLRRAKGRLTGDEHQRALDLRAALRAFVGLEPADRGADDQVAARLNAACASFPLLTVAAPGTVELRPAGDGGVSGLGRILGQLHRLSQTGRLDRLRTCGSEECRWVFFDRSKPGNRRWCSSTLCGNRQKTRAYRRRQRDGDEASA